MGARLQLQKLVVLISNKWKRNKSIRNFGYQYSKIRWWWALLLYTPKQKRPLQYQALNDCSLYTTLVLWHYILQQHDNRCNKKACQNTCFWSLTHPVFFSPKKSSICFLQQLFYIFFRKNWTWVKNGLSEPMQFFWWMILNKDRQHLNNIHLDFFGDFCMWVWSIANAALAARMHFLCPKDSYANWASYY